MWKFLQYYKKITVLCVGSLMIVLSYHQFMNAGYKSLEPVLFPENQPITVLRIGYGGAKPTIKFNKKFHRELEKHFPDWKKRIDFQNEQEKFYILALRRQQVNRRFGIPDKKSSYTEREWDAMEYFQGTGSYKQHQDVTKPPNQFDTRQSFLLKMHNEKLRNQFLKNFHIFNNTN